MTDRDLQQKRIIAAVIDIGIAIVIWGGLAVLSFGGAFIIGRASSSSTIANYLPRVISLFSAVLSLAYVLGRDVLAGDRSLGKKFQNIRVVTVAGGPISVSESVRRNGIFAIGSGLGLLSAILGLIPCLGDAVNCLLFPLYLLGLFATLGAAIFEVVKITQDPEGVRMGDQWAGTRVVR